MESDLHRWIQSNDRLYCTDIDGILTVYLDNRLVLRTDRKSVLAFQAHDQAQTQAVRKALALLNLDYVIAFGEVIKL